MAYDAVASGLVSFNVILGYQSTTDIFIQLLLIIIKKKVAFFNSYWVFIQGLVKMGELSFFSSLFIYFERESAHVQGGTERERERERENPKQFPCCQHRACRGAQSHEL